MRVECSSISDFVVNLKKAPALFMGTVFVDVSHELVSEHKRRVVVHASAVVLVGDDGEYLLQGSELCGFDFSDQETKLEGTERAEQLVRLIENVYMDPPLTILPGKATE